MKIKMLCILFALAVMACNKKKDSESELVVTEATDTVAVDTMRTGSETGQLYACSMHPEVQGNKGEKCSKCGMALTEEVIAN